MRPWFLLGILLSLIFCMGMPQYAAAEEPVDYGAKLLAVTFDDGPGADTIMPNLPVSVQRHCKMI